MLLTESLVLSGIGAAVGMGLGYGLLKWIQSLLPPFYLPAEANVAIDQRVLVFLAAVTLLTSIAFGLAPAIQAFTPRFRRSVGGGRPWKQHQAGGRLYVRHAFVAFQVAGGIHSPGRRRIVGSKLCASHERGYRLRNRRRDRGVPAGADGT
jgi:hypothetical protein